MTHYIAHRINTIEELNKIPKCYGVEIDLRDSGKDIILQHDPFLSGEKFSDFLNHYDHGTLILNIKSERIEHKILDLLKQHSIQDYFFLDSSFPMIYLLSVSGERQSAIRFSEFESLDTVLSMKNKIDWVWVDCFSKLPIDSHSYQVLKSSGFKLCLVSPELQGRPEDIQVYQSYLSKNEIIFDAICTKIHNINKWQNHDNH